MPNIALVRIENEDIFNFFDLAPGSKMKKKKKKHTSNEIGDDVKTDRKEGGGENRKKPA